MFKNRTFGLRALASAAATASVALTLAASPRAADAAAYQFALQDLAPFTTFAQVDPALTFSGSGFIGMIDDRWGSQQIAWAHVLGLETDSLSRTLMQVDLAALAGLQVVSAHLSFDILHGHETGTNSVVVQGFDSGGTLGLQWRFPSHSHGSALGTASAGQRSQIDITQMLQHSVDNGHGWLGMHLQAVGIHHLYTVTHDHPDIIDRDLARVRLDVITAAVPEPATWGLMFAGLAAVGGLARRRGRGGR